MMEILSENRDLKPYIKEAENMITQVNIENLPSYELGMEKGMEKGIEQGMEKGIELIVQQLLTKHDTETVAELTNLSVSQIQAMLKKQGRSD